MYVCSAARAMRLFLRPANAPVKNMRKVGNVVSNKLYNPENKKPPVPIDADEADSAMERFIRQKYVSRTLSTNKKQNTGGSSDETPPPLPPKTPSRFGLRSASSIFPLGSKAKKASANQEPTSPQDRQRRSPPPRNKASPVFGASIERHRTGEDDMEQKLAKLRDMGFTDNQRNATVLKGVGGSLEKAVEALIRLGEGGRRSPTLLAPARTSAMPVSRSLTPTPTGPSSEASRTRPISPASTNPFDMLDTPPPPQPLSSQSTGTLQTKNPYLSMNPFGPPQPTPSALDLAFQNMSLAPTSQPLFPHHTGGQVHQQSTQSFYQQPMTAPMTAPLTAPLPPTTQGYSAVGVNGSQTYPQPLQPAATGYNPFLTVQPTQQQPLSVNTTQFGGSFGNNPFTRSPTRIQSPTLSQIPEQTQQNFYAPPPQSQTTNPFFAQMQQPAVQHMPGQMQMPQQMGLVPQMTGYAPQPQRPDKASILALYNQPRPASDSNPFQANDSGQMAPAQTPNAQQQPSQQQSQQQQQQQQQQLQQPTPINPAGSKNPFVGAGTGRGGLSTGAVQSGQLAESAPKPNVSRESMMAFGLEWSNGRHSPDAFASLSARDTR